MLFAYNLSGDMPLTDAFIANLQRAASTVSADCLPTGQSLTLVWDTMATGEVAEGSFLRGYEQVTERGHAVCLVHALRQLSRRLPDVSITLSGWGELPPTEIKNGEIQMFCAAYDRVLAATAGWSTSDELVKRIPS